MNPIVILPARDGGFVVRQQNEPGYLSETLYAGTLAATLNYVQRHFTPPKKAKPAK